MVEEGDILQVFGSVFRVAPCQLLWQGALQLELISVVGLTGEKRGACGTFAVLESGVPPEGIVLRLEEIVRL